MKEHTMRKNGKSKVIFFIIIIMWTYLEKDTVNI